MRTTKTTLTSSIKSLIIVTMLFLTAVSVLMVLFFRFPASFPGTPVQGTTIQATNALVAATQTLKQLPLLQSKPGLLIFSVFFAGTVFILLMLFRLLRQYKTKLHEMDERLNTDALTGLSNRMAFDRVLALEVSRAARYQMTFSLALFDLDGLKMINDFFGREGGDFILQRAADGIRKLIRDVDALFYVGSGTYALILPSTEISGAFILSERLRHALTQLSWEYKGREIAVTASFGVSEFQQARESPAELYSRVENLLFRAKKSGRNRVC